MGRGARNAPLPHAGGIGARQVKAAKHIEPLDPDEWQDVPTRPYEPVPAVVEHDPNEDTLRDAPREPERIRCVVCEGYGGTAAGDLWRSCSYCGGSGWIVPMAPERST